MTILKSVNNNKGFGINVDEENEIENVEIRENIENAENN